MPLKLKVIPQCALDWKLALVWFVISYFQDIGIRAVLMGEGAHPLNKSVPLQEMWFNLYKSLASVLISILTLMLMEMIKLSYTVKQCIIIIRKNCS